MAKLPTVVSNVPRDLRMFLDRVREAFNASGDGQIVTLGDLENYGVVTRAGGEVFPAAVPTAPGRGDYVTPPAPQNLTADGALANIILSWDAPIYRGHAYTEVWAAEEPVGGGVPDLGEAVLIGMAPGTVFAHNIGSSATRWYWIRFVNIGDEIGPFNAVEGVQGSTGQDPAYLLDLLSGEITESQLFQALGDRIDLIDGPDTLTGSVAARIASEATTRASADSALSQSINTLQSTVNGNTAAIQTEATTRASADGALQAQYTVKVDVNGYVSGFGLASTAINATPTSEFIVRADTFAIASPSGPDIAPAEPFIVRTTPTTINGVSVPTGVYIKDGFIQNGTITNAKIGNAAIDNAKIANLSAEKITAGTLNADRIAANTIDGSKISTNLLGAKLAQITEAYVADANIQNATITNAKIANLDAGKINAGFISSARIQAGSITADKINVTDLSAISATIGTFQSAATGQRLVIRDDKIEVYDANNVLRVRIGNLS